MENFYIEELSLKNYRGIEKKTFHLNPNFTVFIGKNASGKTTVLEAVAVMLGAYLAAFKTYVPSRYVFNISKFDPTIKQQKNIDADLPTSSGIPQYPCEVSCKMLWGAKAFTKDREIIFKRTVEKEAGRTKFSGHNPMQKIVLGWENDISKADGSDKGIVFPLVLYLSSARLWNESSASSFQGLPIRMDAYTKCLDKKHGTQLSFEYLKKLKQIALEEEREPFPQYKAILGAVNESMKEELNEGEKIIFSSRFGNGEGEVALMKKDKTVIPFSSLSDGYRNVIKVIIDIASRMCILNPYLKENALKETPGIVIIDELDLSLHPTWQKRIVSILKNIFPKVQFICATHSPFIIQSLEEGELCSLEKVIEEEHSGESIEDISEEIINRNICWN